MAALKQSRTQDQVETKSSAAARGAAPSCAAVLGVRLWTDQEYGESDASFWKSSAPAVWLIVDLIAASEGVTSVTHGKIIAANFPTIRAAISAARRLQWAIQGFSETESLKGTGIAVLVCAADEVGSQPADHSFLHPLDQAAPGQILLTERTCQLLEELPVFSLRASTLAGLRELLWRGPKGESTRSSDERNLAQLIEQHGLQDPVRPDDRTIIGPKPTPVGESAKMPAARDSRDSILPPHEGGGKSRWLIGGVCVAVLLIVVAIIALSHGNKASTGSPVRAGEATSTSGTAGSSASPAQPTPPDTPVHEPPPNTVAPKENKAAGKSAERTRKDKDKEERAQSKSVEEPVAPTPAPKRGNCELDAQELPDLIDAGERSLGRGHYEDAERQFGSVLGCDPGNGRARAGLERARKAIQSSR